MKQAKVFSIVVMLAVLCYGGVGFYFLPRATFQGELTRMSLLPETLFGWTKAQPSIDKQWMKQAAMQDADVLVIGDSFSDGRIWQTRLTRQGYKVRTETWDSMRGICADFMPWLRDQGFHGRFIVLESIERNLVNDLKKSVACQKMQYHPNARTDAPRYPPAVSFDVNGGNYAGKLSTGFRTLLHVLEYERLSQAQDFSTWVLPNDVTMARIENGCALFSHASCNDTLFLSYDLHGEVDDSALDNIATLNARMEGVTPVWMFVPNKSTVYRYPDKQFWNKAEVRYGAPNLMRMMQRAVDDRIIDLYPANNTHVSTTGYLLLGDEILKVLQKNTATSKSH
ncbi:MAG: hypothetical protein PHH36_04385 [Sideroxydans sp.]|nr:hypothetical protein [Sideroxydans sp.]